MQQLRYELVIHSNPQFVKIGSAITSSGNTNIKRHSIQTRGTIKKMTVQLN